MFMSGISVNSNLHAKLREINSDNKITSKEAKELNDLAKSDGTISYDEQQVLESVASEKDFTAVKRTGKATFDPLKLSFNKQSPIDVETKNELKKTVSDNRLNKATELIFRAMDGAGTNEEAIVKILEYLPKEERSKVRDKFNEKYLDKTGKSFDAWIDKELNTIADEPIKSKIYSLVDRSVGEPSPLRKNFEKEFRDFSKKHWSDANSMATGSLNNAIVTASFGTLGDGCTEWQSQIMNVAQNWASSDPSKHISIEEIHVDVGIAGSANHNLARATFPDGTTAILDPWSNPDKPFHDEETYRVEHGGKLFEGAYRNKDKFFGERKEISYVNNQTYYPNH
jgi:hypothetical protein